MKVILIKDSVAGKALTIVDVKAGYGQNFLIRNNLAMPINPQNLAKLDKILASQAKERKLQREAALKLKEKLEKVNLEFSLKVTKSNEGQILIHHSVSNKQILSALQNQGLNLKKQQIAKVQLNTLGEHQIKIALFEEIEAHLKITIIKEA